MAAPTTPLEYLQEKTTQSLRDENARLREQLANRDELIELQTQHLAATRHALAKASDELNAVVRRQREDLIARAVDL